MRLLRLLGRLKNRDALVLSLLLAVGTCAYFGMPDAHGHRGGVVEYDGYYYYIYLRSLQMDGDLDFTNEYEQWGNPFKFGKTATGRARNVFGIGPAVLWSPWFLLANGLAAVGRWLGSPIPVDGLSRFHQTVTFYGSLIYGWLALLCCYIIARRLFGQPHALWAALGAALAGPLPYYCLSHASWSHAPAAMATSLTVLLWLHFRDAWSVRRWALCGASLGLAVLVRPATVPFALLLVAEAIRFGWPVRRRPRELLRRLLGPLAGAGAALFVFSPQLCIWQLLYGSPLIVPQGRGFLWWSDSAWLQSLFSPRNGLLPSAPLYALSLWGLLRLLWRPRHAPVAVPLLLAFVGLLALNGVVHDWWGGDFSARRFTAALPVFAVGLAAALSAAREWLARRPQATIAWLTGGVVAAAVLFNIEWMHQVSRFNLRWYGVRSTEGLYMTVSHRLVERVYDAVGNPLSLPASLAAAARHGLSLRAFDRVDGSYLLGEVNPETMPSADPYFHAMMPLFSLRFRYNLSESFGRRKRDGEVAYVPLRSPRGAVFLPLNRPGPLRLWIRGRARWRGTEVVLGFNGERLRRTALAHDRWAVLQLSVPAQLVRRGINRLDLTHRLPRGWDAPGAREIGGTGQRSPVDIAVATGGLKAGRFCEIWVGGEQLACAGRGLTAVVLHRRTGAVLGQRSFDVHLHPVLYRELGRFLEHFPTGSPVAIAAREDAGDYFAGRGEAALRRIGAGTDLARQSDAGYAAIGVLGAAPGTAVESLVEDDHARAHVGRPPPPWRVVARYSAIRLR